MTITGKKKKASSTFKVEFSVFYTHTERVPWNQTEFINCTETGSSRTDSLHSQSHLEGETVHRAQPCKHAGLISLCLHQSGIARRKIWWNMYKEKAKRRVSVSAASNWEKNKNKLKKKTKHKHTKYRTEQHYREYCFLIFTLCLYGASTSWGVSTYLCEPQCVYQNHWKG